MKLLNTFIALAFVAADDLEVSKGGVPDDFPYPNAGEGY